MSFIAPSPESKPESPRGNLKTQEESAYNERSWLKRARTTSRKINFGWWVQSYNIPLTCSAILIATTVLSARYYEKLPSHAVSILIIIAILSLCGVACWFFIRKKFEKPEESLVRLEDKLKLKNTLSAAKAGITPWPNAQPDSNTNLDWHLPRTLLPSFLSLSVIVCSFFVPIGSYANNKITPPAPDSLSGIENMLEQLKDDDIIQEDYIEEIEEQIEEIKQQDPTEWFSHSSLEAIDNLTDNHDAAAKDIKENLQSAERALQSLQKHGDKLSATDKENLLNQFAKAVENLDTGNMKPNKELLDQLKKIDPKQLNQLTPEQLNQLRENMRDMANKLKQQQKDSGDKNEDSENDDENGDGDGDGDKESEGWPNGGKGGLGRGPGHAPNLLGNETDKLNTGDFEKLDPKSLENTLPGDLLETSDGEHETDKTDAKIRSGGNTQNKGDGGERVWKNSLLPEEKKALKKFFK